MGRQIVSEDENTQAVIDALLERRDKLILARDILALELEIKHLKQELKPNVNTDSKESETGQSV